MRGEGPDCEVAVVGAGVVGCAVAARLACAGRSVLLLEREAGPGTQTTSRNSGVVHSGLYYAPGSLKARTCVAGNRALWDFAAERGIPHARIGKLVVAADQGELPALEALLANARASDAAGCRLVGPAELSRLEPALPPRPAALWCPASGIVDPHALTRAYLARAEAGGAVFAPRSVVTGIRESLRGFALDTARGPVVAERLVNAAGLFADEVAGMLGLARTIHPWRGDYFRLRAPVRYQRLVYPLRRTHEVGLGIHLTLGLDGSVRLGPDAEPASSKHDYGPAEHKRDAFASAAARLLGDVVPEQLSYDGCGLRPRLSAGPAPLDFEIAEHPPGALHLLGIESPGLTAAGALADLIAQRLG